MGENSTRKISSFYMILECLVTLWRSGQISLLGELWVILSYEVSHYWVRNESVLSQMWVISDLSHITELLWVIAWVIAWVIGWVMVWVTPTELIWVTVWVIFWVIAWVMHESSLSHLDWIGMSHCVSHSMSHSVSHGLSHCMSHLLIIVLSQMLSKAEEMLTIEYLTIIIYLLIILI